MGVSSEEEDERDAGVPTRESTGVSAEHSEAMIEAMRGHEGCSVMTGEAERRALRHSRKMVLWCCETEMR